MGFVSWSEGKFGRKWKALYATGLVILAVLAIVAASYYSGGGA